MPTLGDIIRRHGQEYLARHGPAVPSARSSRSRTPRHVKRSRQRLAYSTPPRSPRQRRSPSRSARIVATACASSRSSSTASASATPDSTGHDPATRALLDSTDKPRDKARHAPAMSRACPAAANRWPRGLRKPRRRLRRPRALGHGLATGLHPPLCAFLKPRRSEAFPIALNSSKEPAGPLNQGFELGFARSKPHLVTHLSASPFRHTNQPSLLV